MYPYMRDHREKASGAIYYDFDHARELILARDPQEIARLSGVCFDEGKSEFTFESLGQNITVSYPECRARQTETGETPALVWHLTMLHYLEAADGAPLSGKWVAIRDMGEHMAHPQTFENHVTGELAKNLANEPLQNIKEAAAALGADIQKGSADLHAVFHFLPRFPILVQIWLTDEEMTGSAKVLFDARGAHYLPGSDIYHGGTMFVDFLVSQYKLMFP